MRPKEELIRRARENGSMERLNMLLSAAHILLSAAHILFCEASNIYGEAADIMRRNGLLLGELKMLQTRYEQAQDRYFKEFALMVDTEKSKMNMFTDLEEFDKKFREWANLPADWKPKVTGKEEEA